MSTHSVRDTTLAVRKSLLALQKELLNHLLEGFERENARTVPPSEWLQMIMLAQRYAWLREMTSLIADIDVLTELQEVSEEDAAAARAEVERLLFDPELQSDFGKNYRNALKAETNLLLPHGHLRAEMQKLPKKEVPAEKSAATRKRWHEDHKHQLRHRRS